MKIREIVLLEDRAEYIAQTMKNKLEAAAEKDLGRTVDSLQLVNQLKQADPTGGKSLQWLANMYATNQFKLEDLPRLRSEMEKFVRLRAQLPIKDLNQIRQVGDLYDMLDQHAAQGQPEPVSKRAQEREVKKDIDVVMDTPNFKVLVPKTEAASCLYGAGTRWCTSGEKENRFDYYSSKGTIYIILTNLGGKPRKFQLHVEENQFKDERDIDVGKEDIAKLSAVPEYTKFLNMLIKKYYGKYFTNKA